MRLVLSRVCWLLAIVWATPVFALFEKTEQRVLETGATVRLALDLTRGRVTIDPVDGATEVRLTIRRAFATNKEEDVPAMERRHQLEFTREGETVKLRSRYEGEMGPQPTWIDWPPVDFTFELQVPKTCSVEIVGGRVDAMIGAVKGNVNVRLDTGEMSLQQIDGSVDASTKTGSITLSSCSGSVKLKARSGSVFVGPVAGDVVVVAGSGDAEVQAVAGNTDVLAVTGDVKVGFAGNFQGKAKLATDGGNVTAIFDPAVNCDLEASTFWGRVENKLQGLLPRGSVSRGHLAGVLGRGGSRVVVKAGGGHVYLRTAPVAWKDALSPAFTEAAEQPAAPTAATAPGGDGAQAGS